MKTAKNAVATDSKAIKCDGCGEYFTPERENQRHHNDHCRFRAWDRKHPRLKPLNFDGQTFDPKQDGKRLTRQFDCVLALMHDGEWHTIREVYERIRQYCNASENGVSARLRDLRKPAYGGYTVERRRHSGGLFEYRLIPRQETE